MVGNGRLLCELVVMGKRPFAVCVSCGGETAVLLGELVVMGKRPFAM